MMRFSAKSLQNLGWTEQISPKNVALVKSFSVLYFKIQIKPNLVSQMATDGFVGMFFLPVLIGLAVLMWAAFFAKGAWQESEIYSLKIRHILQGILGALLGLAIYSIGTSYVEALDRIAKYESLKEVGHLNLTLSWSIYLFVLFSPFLILGFLLVFLPLLLGFFSRIRLVSVLGVTIILAILAAMNAGHTYISPYNNWCAANLALCTYESVVRFLIMATPILLGFSLGARLPLLRS